MYLPFFQVTIREVIGHLTQKLFHGQAWAIPLLFLHKKVKGLEFIRSVSFAFVAVLWTHIMQLKELFIQVKQTMLCFKNKTNPSER